MRARRLALASAMAMTVAALSLLAGGTATGGSMTLRLDPIGVFNRPLYVENAPAHPHMLFVVEQPGRIETLRRGHRLDHPFLDVTDRVATVSSEQGLLSVAFAPDYARSRLLYVDYINRHGNIEIDEFKAERAHPSRARPASRRRVLIIPHSSDPSQLHHYGGQLQFGPDGKLWISTGDGSNGGDGFDNARHLNVLLGKILRIEPRKHRGHRYRVPRGNPYVGAPGRNEIYSYGLRNPWRFSFDAVSGNLAIGDVGQAAVEEIDYTTRAQAKGANFGWPQYEGNSLYDPSRPGPDPPTFPIHTYTHSEGCAVIGGYVLRNRRLSLLEGRYVYSDNCNGDIRSLVPATSGASDDQSTGLNVPYATSFGEGAYGRIYVTSGGGPVYRLRQG